MQPIKYKIEGKKEAEKLRSNRLIMKMIRDLMESLLINIDI